MQLIMTNDRLQQAIRRKVPRPIDAHLAVSRLLIPIEDWHDRLPDPTLGDAILDRLVHNAYRLQLEGESMRKAYSPLHLPTS